MSGNFAPRLEGSRAGPRAGLVSSGIRATALLAVVFVALCVWSWGKWTDAHIDYGNELYIAWQLSEGQALYRDIAIRHGPLSHYVNAVWFAAFGVSLRTLVLCNLAVLAAICLMLYRLFRRACDAVTATAVCLMLLTVFAFSQYVGVANYNYVTPYHHFQTHGIALALAMILALEACLRRRAPGGCGVAGACLGLVFLTKAELFVPAAGAAAVGLALVAGSRVSEAGRALALFALGALLPVAAFFVLLWAQMPWERALGGVLGNWAHLSGGVFGDPFYRRGAGLDDLAGNGWLVLRACAGIAVFAALAAGADRLLRSGERAAIWSAAAGVALFALLTFAPIRIPWAQLARALPLIGALAAVSLVAAAWRRRGDPAEMARVAPLALFAVYAVGMLAKMPLNARIAHYGFALAMPATMLLVSLLVHHLPRWKGLGEGGGRLARALTLAALAAFAVFHLRWSDRIYDRKDFPVATGSDAIFADDPRINPRPRIISQGLSRLEAILPPEATLLVLPEGAGLNYWARRRNPTRFNLFLPVELDAFGRDAILRDLREHPPDYVALVHRNHAEFGVGPFGVDPRNGRALVQWIRENYRRIERVGAEPFTGRGFGMVLLRRKDA